MNKPRYRFTVKVGNKTNSYNLNAVEGDYETAAEELKQFDWERVLKNLDLAWVEERAKELDGNK